MLRVYGSRVQYKVRAKGYTTGIGFVARAVVTSPQRVRVPSGAYSKSCRLSTGGPSLQVTAPENDSDNSPPSDQDTSLNRNLQSPLLHGALLM